MYSYGNYPLSSSSSRAIDVDEGRITNQIRSADYRTNGKLKAKDSTFEGNVEARDDISLTSVVALRSIQCSMGSIKAEGCKLNFVKARDGAKLSNTTASTIEVKMGKLTWRNSELKEISAEYIEARDGIRLSKVSCERTTKCSMGVIKAKEASLSLVFARDGVELRNSSAHTVKVDMGTLTVENENPGTKFLQLTARDGIQLQNIQVDGAVTCKMGKIKAENCQLYTVFSRDGIALFNSSANACEVEMGDLFILAKDRLVYQTLSARDDICLENIEVKNPVRSKFGKFNATHCTLPEIQGAQKINLVNTVCQSATLLVPKGNKGVVYLEDGIIEGDLVIEVVENSSFNGTGTTFNITVSDLSSLQVMSLYGDSKGFVNGMPYKYVYPRKFKNWSGDPQLA